MYICPLSNYRLIICFIRGIFHNYYAYGAFILYPTQGVWHFSTNPLLSPIQLCHTYIIWQHCPPIWKTVPSTLEIPPSPSKTCPENNLFWSNPPNFLLILNNLPEHLRPHITVFNSNIVNFFVIQFCLFDKQVYIRYQPNHWITFVI